jgi:hypothetical protein
MKKPRLIFLSVMVAAGCLSAAANEDAVSVQTNAAATVIATEQAPPYVYVQLEIDGEKVWYAAPETVYVIGEKVVAPSGGVPMKDFYSKTLDRTFDMVYFVGSITRANPPAEEELPAGHPPLDTGAAGAPETFDFSGVERPADGLTIEEIYARKDVLEGEKVVLQGIAVKVTNGILGKNWIHLRDGSGEKGTDDLLVTTTKEVEVGETVTVTGTLLLDQDFGAGYRYDVLLEATDILGR